MASSLAKPNSVGQRVSKQSLYPQLRQARFWLPLTIVGVVIFYQLVFVPLGGASWQFWSVLLFYSLLGPVVTFITLDWIASEVKQRENAQAELSHLYDELRSSHALLGSIQTVTEQFAAAPDLEAALSAASRGVVQVTGALGAAVFLRPEGVDITDTQGLSAAMQANAVARDERLARRLDLQDEVSIDRERYFVLTTPIVWAGRLQGSVHAYYSDAPGKDQRESFSILSAEFSAAAEAARSRTRDLMTLVEVDRSIRAEGNLERLLETLLTQVMSRADASLGGVYLSDDDGRLQLRACHGENAPCGPGGVPVKLGEGFVGKAAEQAEPRIAASLGDQERVLSGPLLRNASSAVALPLLDEKELLGVVVLAHGAPNHFEEGSLPFLNLVAGQMRLAVRNASAYLQSEELAIAEERARIAREIHDGVAQSLAFSALKLDLVARLLTTDPSKAEAELGATKEVLRELIKEVRRSIFALSPVDLEQHGFVETVRRYTRDYGEQNSIKVELEIQAFPQLSAQSEAVLFRIFQESMHNVAKHAGADTVKVVLGTSAASQAFVIVEDNGRGFDPLSISGRVTSAGGLGLKQMKQRVENRGGMFKVSSEPSVGTSVFASIPD